MSREDPKARLPDSPGQYNPLDKRNLAKSVADALLQQTLGPLPPQERFLGAGIYAIYYAGRFVRIPAIVNAHSGHRDHRFRASRSLIGAKRRRQVVP